MESGIYKPRDAKGGWKLPHAWREAGDGFPLTALLTPQL